MGSPTGLYGAERWILALVKHLPSERVHSIVSVLKDSPDYRAELCEHAALLGVDTHVFEAYGKFSFSSVTLLRRFIREQQIDVLHTHGYKTDLIGLLATLGTDCRLLSTPHGWSVDAGLALRAYEALNRVSFALMSAVAPLSDELHRELVRMPWLRKRLHLIRNGVDLSEVHAAPETCPELSGFKERGDFILGYIGQLIPRKGIDWMMKGLAALKSPRVRLCLVGDGPQRRELESLAADLGISDRVHFYGYRADRLSFLKQFDAFVLPSALEGIPRCVMEAMAAKVAVIATDIPGCRDVIQHDRTGLLIPVGDEAAVTRAVARLESDPSLCDRLGAAGNALVENEYSAATMAARYEALYQQMTPVTKHASRLAKAVE